MTETTKQLSIQNLLCVTWNIGKGDIKYKIFSLIDALIAENSKKITECDVIVIALQETNKNDLRVAHDEIGKYAQIEIGSRRNSFPFEVVVNKGAEGACRWNPKFMIGTIVLRNTLRKHKPLITVWGSSHCVRYSKGYHTVQMQYNRDQITIVNAHLPFKDDVRRNANLLRNLIIHARSQHQCAKRRNNESSTTDLADDSKGDHIDLIVVLGDLNSRSLILKECMTKNAPKSEILDRLGKINYEHEIACSQEDLKSRIDGISNSAGCSEGIDIETIAFDPFCPIPGIIRHDMLRILMSDTSPIDGMVPRDIIDEMVSRTAPKRDEQMMALREVRKCLKGFSEADITFYPTYKRATDTGEFTIAKGSKYRLPGYADRIIYETQNKSEVKYNSLYVQGNDHLPVYALLTVAKHEPVVPSLESSNPTRRYTLNYGRMVC